MDLLPPVDVIDFEGSGEAGLLKSSAAALSCQDAFSKSGRNYAEA